MPDSLLFCIYVAGVTKTEVLHNPGKGNRSDFDKQVNMIRHQAKCMNPVAITLKALLDEKVKPLLRSAFE